MLNYNKTRFLEYKMSVANSKDIDNTRKTYLKSLNDMSKVEADYQVDFCDADYNTLTMMIPDLIMGKHSYRDNTFSIVKSYIEWCVLNGKSRNSENLLDLISLDEIDLSFSYKKIYVKDFDALCDYCDIVFNSVSSGTVDIMYRLMVYLLYYGVKKEDLTNIKISDFDKENDCLLYNNKSISLDDRVVNLINICINTDFFVVGNLNTDTDRKYIKTESGYLISLISKTRIPKNIIQSLNVRITKANNDYKSATKKIIKYTSSNIFYSGMMERVYEKEIQNGKVDTSEFEQIFIKSNFNNSVKNYRIKGFLTDYNEWKKAWDK